MPDVCNKCVGKQVSLDVSRDECQRLRFSVSIMALTVVVIGGLAGHMLRDARESVRVIGVDNVELVKELATKTEVMDEYRRRYEELLRDQESACEAMMEAR